MGKFSLLLIIAVTLSGCIRSESKLTLNPDGTAVFEISYSLAERTIAQLKAARKLGKEIREAGEDKKPEDWQDLFLDIFIDPIEDRIRSELNNYEKYGVTIEKIDIQSRNAWRYAHIKIKCTNLPAFSKTPIFKEYGFSLDRAPDETYLIRRTSRISRQKYKNDQTDLESAQLIGSILAGYYIKISVQTPGRIIETNATRNYLYSADWEYDYGRDPEAMTAFITHDMRLKFQGKGLDLPILSQN